VELEPDALHTRFVWFGMRRMKDIFLCSSPFYLSYFSKKYRELTFKEIDQGIGQIAQGAVSI